MTAPTDLHAGAEVFSSDGQKLGQLHRVVLRRRDLTASHIVVDIGFLRSGRSIWQGGVGLDYDRVVPVEAVGRATDERIDLVMTADQFKDAPEYTVESFEPPKDLTPGEFDIPDVVSTSVRIADYVASVGANYWLYERLRKPEGTFDIKEDTPVWRQDPHEKLGEVERVLFGPDGVAQAFVIRRGFLLKRDVVLPVRYVTEFLDDLVRVDITDDHLEALREYQG
jgi:uncharacterized protein YrrD